MMKTLFFFVATAALAISTVECNKAIAVLTGIGIKGNVTFSDEGGEVRVSGSIVGLGEGYYGFHVHEKGDLSGGCATLLAHFNPHGKHHGHPDDHDRHAGDLGNVHFDESGTAYIDLLDSLLKLSGPESIIGRGLILHERADDYGRTKHPDSKTTGNAGARVACGVIGILEGSHNSAASSTLALASLATTMIIYFM